MDILATQVLEDDDLSSTPPILYSLNQVGVLNVGSNTYPIKEGINKIGRHAECDIVLNEQTVSKKHAEIEANGHETSAWICDLNSSNKTKLNNSVLRPGRCYELKDGGVLEFGTTRAVFRLCSSLDDSMIPETPLPPRQNNQQLIPGTPDSSVELSTSSLGDNVSMIPGTQGDNQESMFRRPSVPQRSSTSKKKSFVHDSFVDDSTDNSRSFTVGNKENVGRQTTSIHDMETQKTFESLDETGDDIYDVETQKICLSNIKNPAELPQDETSDIHDMETQHEDTEDNTFGTNETKVQSDVDIHDAKTPKRSGTRSVTWDIDDSARNNLAASPTAEKSPETVIPKTEVTEDTFSSDSHNEDKIKEDDTIRTEYSKDLQKTSEEYLQLSLNTNFEEEDCSELDISRNLLGSQNLLDHLMEENRPDQTKSKVPTPEKSTSENDIEEKSTDDENIFDAVTQVKIHDENAYKGVSQNVNDVFKVSADDSDETNQGVFQSYSYVRSKDTEKSSQDQSVSDDSDTDEEGQFLKIALRERQKVKSPFERPQNGDSEAKTNRSSSKESEDMFDMLTQHTNPANKKSLMKKNNDDDKCEVDFDAPTQVIVQEKSRTDEEPKDIELMETQILPKTEFPVKEVPSTSVTEHKKVAIDQDVTEMEDDVATQIITPPKEISNESPTQLIENIIEECSVEDIDYETAPTQLIVDTSEEKSNKKKVPKKSKVPNVSSLVNDSLERNLNAMFGDVTDDSLEDQQQISTQVLRNVLQLSECEDEPQNTKPTSNVDSDSATKDKVKKSTRKSRRKSQAAVSGSSSAVNKKTRVSAVKDVNTDSDSQNTENYFSVLTSRRKRNVLIDSQDLAEASEHKSDDEEKNEHKSDDEEKNEHKSNDEEKNEQTAESETINIVEDKSSVCDNPRSKSETPTPMAAEKKKYVEPKVVLEQITIPIEKPKVPEEMAVSCEKPIESSKETELPNEEPKVVPEEVAIPCEKPKDSSEETAVSNEEPKVASEEMAIPCEKPKDSSEETAVSNEEPKVASEEMAIPCEKPKDSSEETAVSNEEPKVASEEMAIPCEKPKDSSEETAVSNEEPKVASEEMAIPCEKPKDSSEETAVSNEEPKVVPEEKAAVEDLSNKPSTEINEPIPSTSNDLEDKQNHSMLDDDDEDILAGLPEVRISGTLWNPPSPSLSSKSEDIESTKSKTAASKKKGSTRKSTRKRRVTRKVAENIETYLSINKPDPNRSKSLSDAAPADIDTDALSTEISEKVNENPKRSLRNATTGSSQSSKESDSLDGKSTPSVDNVQEQARRSPFVQSNGRTRNSSKKDVDRSSIFQVRTEAPAENIEPAKSNVNASRTGKRSLSTTDGVEDNAVKKPREEEESTLKTTRSKRSNSKSGKRYTANIMNPLTLKNSPINIKDPDRTKLPLDESNLINKQAVINIIRISPYDSASSLSPSSPVEFIAKGVSKEAKLAAPKAILGQSRVSPLPKVEPRQSRSRKAASKFTVIEEDASPRGAESQEVEEIMSGSLIEENINTGIDTRTPVDTNEDVDTNKKGAKTRNSRKRTRTNTPSSRDASVSSISSDVCEANETHFEVPASRSKRAKISKNISNVPDITVNEEPVAKARNSRQSTRAKQAQPQVIPESSEEEHLENSADQSNLDTTVNTTKSRRGQRTKAGKAAANKTEDKSIIDNSVSSEINSSIDNASINSTLSRVRKSVSSAASPLKTKHKILMTGLANSDYKQLLKKLGASSVENPNNCTVLVTDQVRRTVKFLCALAQSIPIVSVDWLVESDKVGHFVELENYILKDPAAEAKFGFRLRGSLEKAKEHKLLEGYTILLTPKVKPPVPELKTIITSCGGKALVKPPQSWPEKALIISCEEDLMNAKKLLAKAPKNVTVQKTEFILTGILKQELDFTEHKLI
nr:PREDICTED: mediator of DNA damage checkpoint protein 1-like isoform X2 [Megachile rotundata]